VVPDFVPEAGEFFTCSFYSLIVEYDCTVFSVIAGFQVEVSEFGVFEPDISIVNCRCRFDLIIPPI